MTHTPTPWKHLGFGRGKFGAVLEKSNITVILGECHGNETDLADQNAAFIVKAVNCHDELVSTLKKALSWGEAEIHSEYGGTRRLNERLGELDFIRDAIQKAEA